MPCQMYERSIVRHSCPNIAELPVSQFNSAERKALLSIKGVGPTVITRLEQLGISNFHDLAERNAADICATVSTTLGSTCWKNSPQASAAIAAAIAYAKEHRDG